MHGKIDVHESRSLNWGALQIRWPTRLNSILATHPAFHSHAELRLVTHGEGAAIEVDPPAIRQQVLAGISTTKNHQTQAQAHADPEHNASRHAHRAGCDHHHKMVSAPASWNRRRALPCAFSKILKNILACESSSSARFEGVERHTLAPSPQALPAAARNLISAVLILTGWHQNFQQTCCIL